MPSAHSGFTTYDAAPDLDPELPEVPTGLLGVSRSAVELATGRIELLHPRDAMDLIYRQNFGMDGDEPPYWAQPWPCGVELAAAIAARDVRGARVLELGCGLALPSLAAAQGGARVLATDWAEGALEFATYNARRNGLRLDVAVCDWADPAAVLADGPWDLVLAADLLYAHDGLDALGALMPRLVTAGGELWLADQGRPPAREFLRGCERWADITTTTTPNPDVRVHRLAPR
ncbi:class I SAM-dependent methyltransferase [Pseudonocardia xishanensis]|uniref:Nicotinamide N-methyase n=1 Tax=Pseudonocardia xishanensis TaxID=630995 RepID=A0ABP8RI75_9PSEU